LAAFETARPRILGALLDVIVYGLRRLPDTRLARLPRMADFALFATACEGALWEAGTFARAYAANRDEADQTVIEGDAVATGVSELIASRMSWDGTAKELLSKLAALAGDTATKAKTWPATPRALSGRLRRVAPNLRRLGIDIEFARGTGRNRERRIIISTSADRAGDRPSAPSAPSGAEEKRSFGADSTRTQNGPADGAAEPTVRKNERKTAGADGADAKIPTLSGDAELAPDRTMGRLTL
jgi:hypothetical protein